MRFVRCLALCLSACVGDVVPPQQAGEGENPWTNTWDDVFGTPDGGVHNPSPDSGSFQGSDVPGRDGSAGGGDPGRGDADTGTGPDRPDPIPDPAITLEDPCGTGSVRFADSVRIRDIALYQTVKVPLVENGSWVTNRNAPVVQNKAGMLRVFVEPQSGFSAHALRAVLTIESGGAETQLSAELNARAASSDAELGSTFNFELEPTLLGGDTSLRVSLIEHDCQRTSSAQNTAARFPSDGLQALEATSIGKLRVVLVPVRLGGIAPDPNATLLANMQTALEAYYPVPSVEVSARAAIDWSYGVRADGSGWAELLNEIRRVRQRDGVDRDVYYFGLISPASSFLSYCRAGCVLGMAPQTTFVSSADQVGLGVGFAHATTYTTAVHELGHAHGRGHAPCVPNGGSIQGVDRSYPYSGADIGSWGWDAQRSELIAPNHKDIMSYCEPAWISDYTYRALADRAQTVNTSARVLTKSVQDESWHNLIVYADGTARWSGLVTSEAPAARESAVVRDRQGAVLATIEVAVVELDHSADGFMYVPEPAPNWGSIEVSDRLLVLDDIAPAL